MSPSRSGIAAATESYGMTVVTADFDEDGWPDIFVACDSTPSLLFMNNHDGTFREEGVMRGVALSDDGMEQAGMGVGIGDYNLDGHLDLVQDAFHRRHQRSLSQRRKGKLRRCHPRGEDRSGDPLHELGRRHRGPGQRRLPRLFSS